MRIACLGDSLTEGDYGVKGKRGIANVQKENYPTFLAQDLGVPVDNYGKCGYTSTSYLSYYRTGEVNVKEADVILLMLGTNGGLDPARQTQGNDDYRTLIRLLRQDAPRARLILCTPPHVTEDESYSNCGYAPQVRNAVAFVRSLAKEMSLPLIDVALCPAFGKETEAVMQPNDGLHFSREGYRALAAFVQSELEKIAAVKS